MSFLALSTISELSAAWSSLSLMWVTSDLGMKRGLVGSVWWEMVSSAVMCVGNPRSKVRHEEVCSLAVVLMRK